MRLHRCPRTVRSMERRSTKRLPRLSAARFRRHELFPAPARCRDRRRADRVQCGRRAPRAGALAMPYDRPGRPHVAARRRHQRHLRDGASRAGDRAVSRGAVARRRRSIRCAAGRACASARSTAAWASTRCPSGRRSRSIADWRPSEQPEAAYDELDSTTSRSTPISAAAASSTIRRSCRARAQRPATIGRWPSGWRDLCAKHGRASELVGVPYGTDAAAISAAGVPTVVFGPGSIDQAHTADEFIGSTSCSLATEIFYRIACDGLRIDAER